MISGILPDFGNFFISTFMATSFLWKFKYFADFSKGIKKERKWGWGEGDDQKEVGSFRRVGYINSIIIVNIDGGDDYCLDDFDCGFGG